MTTTRFAWLLGFITLFLGYDHGRANAQRGLREVEEVVTAAPKVARYFGLIPKIPPPAGIGLIRDISPPLQAVSTRGSNPTIVAEPAATPTSPRRIDRMTSNPLGNDVHLPPFSWGSIRGKSSSWLRQKTDEGLEFTAIVSPTIRVTIVDLGQAGDALFIQPLDVNSSDPGLMIDTGLGRSSFNAMRPFLPGPQQSAKLHISHNHRDHTGNLQRLVGDYPNIELLDVGSGPLIENEKSWMPLFLDSGGYTLRSRDHRSFQVTFLENHLESRNENVKSVMTRVVSNGFSYLMTGDAEAKAMSVAMTADSAPVHLSSNPVLKWPHFSLRSNVLKWPHHAWVPRTAKSLGTVIDFLKRVDPELVIISNIGNGQWPMANQHTRNPKNHS